MLKMISTMAVLMRRMKRTGLVILLAGLCGALSWPVPAWAEQPYQVEWSRQLGTSSRDYLYSVAEDRSGGVYISGFTAGSLGGPNAGSYDAFLSKYSSTGDPLWTRQLGTGSSDESYSVAIDGSDGVYISGTTSGSLGGPNAGDYDAFLTKYDSTGNLLWTRQLGTNYHEKSYSVAADGTGGVYISGFTTGSLGGPNAGDYDAFLTKYDSTGNLMWSRQIGTGSSDKSFSVTVDRVSGVYITGVSSGSLGGPNAGDYDAFLTKYDSTGNLMWSRQIGTGSVDYSYSVAADGAGAVYISGTTSGSLGGPQLGMSDAFLAKYDTTGNILWIRQPGTVAFDRCYSVAVDGGGGVYITGMTSGSLGGPNVGWGDAFLIKYDAQGNLLWGTQLGTDREDLSFCVATGGEGTIYISGWTKGNLGGPNAGDYDAFLVKFVPEPATLSLLALGGLALLRRRERGYGG